MVTLDAANGRGSSNVNRNIPSHVKLNKNYYQTNKETGDVIKDLIGSYGGPNKADSKNTKVLNSDLSKSNYNGSEDYSGGKINHYNIDNEKQIDIVNDFRECQGEQKLVGPRQADGSF